MLVAVVGSVLVLALPPGRDNKNESDDADEWVVALEIWEAFGTLPVLACVANPGGGVVPPEARFRSNPSNTFPTVDTSRIALGESGVVAVVGIPVYV